MSPKSIVPSEVGLWMIHGNLQTPKVWQPITTQLHQAVSPELNLSIFLEDLWASPGESLKEWAALFCQRVHPHAFKSRILLGYSLGGRLGFHALLHQPELWQGAIIISADSGLASECDRRNCLKKDNVWSIQLLHDNWDNLIQEWNSLPVFCGRQPSYSALEKDYSRLKISKAFQNFSKGHQFNLLSNLQNLNIPVLYISGVEDEKYCQIGQKLAHHCPSITHRIILNSGHRVPWENRNNFISIITHFIEQVLNPKIQTEQ